jgi:hypothetical protein
LIHATAQRAKERIMRNALLGIAAIEARNFEVLPDWKHGNKILLSEETDRLHTAPLTIYVSGKFEKVWGHIQADMSAPGREKALKIIKEIEAGLRNAKPRRISSSNKDGVTTTDYAVGEVLGHQLIMRRKLVRGLKSDGIYRFLCVRRGEEVVEASEVMPFECEITLENGFIKDEAKWLGEEPPVEADAAKFRRRIEDALRKTATSAQMVEIASILGVKA